MYLTDNPTPPTQEKKSLKTNNKLATTAVIHLMILIIMGYKQLCWCKQGLSWEGIVENILVQTGLNYKIYIMF